MPHTSLAKISSYGFCGCLEIEDCKVFCLVYGRMGLRRVFTAAVDMQVRGATIHVSALTEFHPVVSIGTLKTTCGWAPNCGWKVYTSKSDIIYAADGNLQTLRLKLGLQSLQRNGLVSSTAIPRSRKLKKTLRKPRKGRYPKMAGRGNWTV